MKVQQKIRGLEMKNELIRRFDKIIVTKVGDYGKQNLMGILLKKKWEEQNTGKMWWGFQKKFPTPELVESFVQQSNSDVLFLMNRNNKGDNFLISNFPKKIDYNLHKLVKLYDEYRISDKQNWKKCLTYTGCDRAFVFKDLTDASYYIDTSCYQVYCNLGKCTPMNKSQYTLNTHYTWSNSKSIHGTRFDTFCAYFDPSLKPKQSLLFINYQAKLVSPYCVYLRKGGKKITFRP